MRKQLPILVLVAGLMGLATFPALGQQTQGVVSSPILVIDSQRLYLESDFGIRVQQEQDAQIAVLSAENRKIESELAAEEQKLTEQRPNMAAADFRKVADAFDRRVQEIRSIQDGKEVEIAREVENQRKLFFQSLGPVLDEIMRESGALLVLEQRATFARNQALMVTDIALDRVNKLLGSGLDISHDDTENGEDN